MAKLEPAEQSLAAYYPRCNVAYAQKFGFEELFVGGLPSNLTGRMLANVQLHDLNGHAVCIPKRNIKKNNIPMAYNLSALVGATYMGLPLIFTPLYARLIYIFLFNKNYRNLPCYVIMSHMGIAQILLSITYIGIGLFHAFEFNPFGMANAFTKIIVQTIKMEAVLGFVLALNRFTIMFGLELPQFVFKILIGFAWLFLIIACALFFTPWAGYTIVTGDYMPTLDVKLPYSFLLHTIGGFVYEFLLLCTLCLYVLIVIRLFYVKARNKIMKDLKKEAKIMGYAGIRFVCDSLLSIGYHYITLPNNIWLEQFRCASFALFDALQQHQKRFSVLSTTEEHLCSYH
ncbi:hypothetical protein L596_026645 [Steinernema carpocapsae]|uniref:7TM GPCR serpentine receptor class x (Srx) domain-containing protein n=1 Tax=Steinernema carpocapsae TaxID=34508 RepID=A0A4U5M1Y8_STECR|nr:hypothetical protein L596_026645 [Steinernema carpocapsae]